MSSITGSAEKSALNIKTYSNVNIIYLFTIFLLTMGSEVISNAIILALFTIKVRELRIEKRDLYFVFITLLILIPFYLYSNSDILLRFIIYIPRFVIIKIIVEKYLAALSYQSLKRILQAVFFIHCTVILLCFAIPPLNNFLNIILAKQFVSEFRISGLFSGYDFISFFTVLYLYVEYRCNDFKFNLMGYIQLFIGFSATIVTGRFGMVPYIIFFMYIFFKKVTVTKIVAFTIACFGASILFYDRILLFYNTFLLLKDSLQLSDPENSTLSLKDYGSEGQEGFYQLSPLVLYREATLPFTDISKYILPSVFPTPVDSGPSFAVLNIGFILCICLYLFYFKSIYKSINGTVFFTVLILIMDIKFRIILVLMPTVWILLNLNKLRKYELLRSSSYQLN